MKYDKINWQDGTLVSKAYVEIDEIKHEVEPEVMDGTTPITANNLNHMDQGIYDLATTKIEKTVIELLTVDNVAPAKCEHGDKYYNTVDKKVYEAIDTNTWNTDGTIPDKTYLYVDLSNSKLYYYNGTNFNPYGGAGGGAYIGTEEPTDEDANLWINPEEPLNNIGTEVVDTLDGNESHLAPSVRAVNEMTTYSTKEVRIGTWIDGKPIYRKTIIYTHTSTIGDVSGITNIEISHNISNLRTFIRKSCIDINRRELPYVTSSGTGFTYLVGTDSTTSVTLRIIKDTWVARTWYITLEYTKTTD